MESRVRWTPPIRRDRGWERSPNRHPQATSPCLQGRASRRRDCGQACSKRLSPSHPWRRPQPCHGHNLWHSEVRYLALNSTLSQFHPRRLLVTTTIPVSSGSMHMRTSTLLRPQRRATSTACLSHSCSALARPCQSSSGSNQY